MDVKQLTTQALALKTNQSLKPSLITNYDDIDRGFEISIYRSGKLMANGGEYSNEIIKILVEDLKMNPNVVKRMAKRMIDNNWTQSRFKDAVNYVEENCTFYPPKPSEFESYDKKVKFSTYQEISENTAIYTPIYCKGINQPMYIKTEDFNQMNYPKWNEKYRTKRIGTYTDPKTGDKYSV